MTWRSVSRPTTSAVLNVALLAWPISVPVSASISSIEKSPFSYCSTAPSMAYVPIRLPIKFGVSLAITIPLPRWTRANSDTRLTTSGLVSGVGMTSKSLR